MEGRGGEVKGSSSSSSNGGGGGGGASEVRFERSGGERRGGEGQ